MSSGASHSLIGLQVMFSFIILVAASHVAWQALGEALRDNGLNTNNKWSLTVNYSNIKNAVERQNIDKSLTDQLEQLSSVTQLAQTSEPRIPRDLNTDTVFDKSGNYLANSRNINVSPNYLALLDLALVGENFQLGDSELKNYPVLVNQRFADRVSDDPQKVLGKKIFSLDKIAHPIIGIVSNTNFAGASWLETNEVYTPRKFKGWRQHSFLLTASDNSTIEKQVRLLVNKLDTRLDIAQLVTLTSLFDEKRQRHLTAAWLAIILAVVSLVIVVIGVNGIVNYMVQVRRYDLGVKMSMGANNSRLLKDSLSELMLPIGVSLFFAFSLSFLVLGYSRSQPELTFDANWLLVACIVLGFIVISLLASYFPIRKVLMNDPVKALRNE